METSFTALVGRFDTFRLLFLNEAQQNPAYELGKRFRAGFAWQGDVLPGKELEELWPQESDFSKVSRAIFSRHTDHLVWRPALTSMLDFVSTKAAEPEATELLTVDPDNYIQRIKGRAGQLYSTVSKAVHWEFLSTASVIDEPTVKSSIRDVLLLLGELGFISHFATTNFANVDPETAWQDYKALRRDVP
jgi:hypothetical protein